MLKKWGFLQKAVNRGLNLLLFYRMHYIMKCEAAALEIRIRSHI